MQEALRDDLTSKRDRDRRCLAAEEQRKGEQECRRRTDEFAEQVVRRVEVA